MASEVSCFFFSLSRDEKEPEIFKSESQRLVCNKRAQPQRHLPFFPVAVSELAPGRGETGEEITVGILV